MSGQKLSSWLSTNNLEQRHLKSILRAAVPQGAGLMSAILTSYSPISPLEVDDPEASHGTIMTGLHLR